MAGCGWPTFARRSRASLWRIWWRRWWVQRVMCDECTDGRQHEKKQTYSVCQSPVRFEVWSILPVMFSGAGGGSTWGENVSRLSCFHMRMGTFPVSFVPVNGLNLHHGKSDLQICIWMIITTQIIPHEKKKLVFFHEPFPLFLFLLLSRWYHGKITKTEAYNLLMTGTFHLFLRPYSLVMNY